MNIIWIFRSRAHRNWKMHLENEMRWKDEVKTVLTDLMRIKVKHNSMLAFVRLHLHDVTDEISNLSPIPQPH